MSAQKGHDEQTEPKLTIRQVARVLDAVEGALDELEEIISVIPNDPWPKLVQLAYDALSQYEVAADETKVTLPDAEPS